MFPRLAFLAQIRNTMPSVGIQTHASMDPDSLDSHWRLVECDLVEVEVHQDAGISFIEDAARDLLAYRDPIT